MQSLMKVIYYLFTYIERELEKTSAILMKNYLMKIMIVIKK